MNITKETHSTSRVPDVSAGGRVSQQLHALSVLAAELADRSESVLQCVSREPGPCGTAEQTSDWLPSLFDDYSGKARSIENSLRRIESALNRLEL